MVKAIKKITTAAFFLFIVAAMTALFALCADAAEVWKVQDATNMRKSYSTGSSVIDTIPSGTKIKVSAKKVDSSYVWGKTSYSGHSGWCVLQYSKYASGNLGLPTVTTTETTFNGDVSLKWKSVPSAKKYVLKIYKSGSLYKSYSQTSTSKTLSLPVGSYKAKVTASNSMTPSWSATGNSFAFTVTSPLVQTIKITGSSSVIKGKTATLKATVSPSTAENKSVSWSSSDKAVLTVSSKGVVTAVAYGKATVTCKAKDGGGASAKYTVSVVPASCPTPVQSAATASGATFKWSKVSGVKGYQIYKYNSSTKKYAKLADTASTSYTVKDLSSGSEVKVKVRAYAVNGKTTVYGGFSSVITLTSLPAAPKDLVCTSATQKNVSLKWSKVSSADKYAVYRYDTDKKAYVKKATVTSPACTLTCVAGEQVKVKVRAIKALGEKNYYSTYSDTITLYACPASPTVKAQVSGKTAVVSWSKVSGAARYEVQYSKSASSGFTMFSVSDSAVRSCTISGLAAGTYYFRVRAYVTNGNTTCFGGWSTAVKVKIG